MVQVMLRIEAGQWIKIRSGLPNKGFFSSTPIKKYFTKTSDHRVFVALCPMYVIADDPVSHLGEIWIDCKRVHFVRAIKATSNHDWAEQHCLSEDSTPVWGATPIKWPKLRFRLKRMRDETEPISKDVYYVRNVMYAIHDPETERVIADSATGTGVGGWILPKERVTAVLKNREKLVWA